jgi:hypothetical protein
VRLSMEDSRTREYDHKRFSDPRCAKLIHRFCSIEPLIESSILIEAVRNRSLASCYCFSSAMLLVRVSFDRYDKPRRSLNAYQ